MDLGFRAAFRVVFSPSLSEGFSVPGVEFGSPDTDNQYLGAVINGEEEVAPFYQPGEVAAVPVAQSQFALPKPSQIRKCGGCGQSGHRIKTCLNGAGSNSSHRKRSTTATTAAPPIAPEADEAVDYGSGIENEDEENVDEKDDNPLQGNNSDDKDDDEEQENDQTRGEGERRYCGMGGWN